MSSVLSWRLQTAPPCLTTAVNLLFTSDQSDQSAVRQLYSVKPVGPDGSWGLRGSDLHLHTPAISKHILLIRKEKLLGFVFFYFLGWSPATVPRHATLPTIYQSSTAFFCQVAGVWFPPAAANPKAAGLSFPLWSWTVDLSPPSLPPSTSLYKMNLTGSNRLWNSGEMSDVSFLLPSPTSQFQTFASGLLGRGWRAKGFLSKRPKLLKRTGSHRCPRVKYRNGDRVQC